MAKKVKTKVKAKSKKASFESSKRSIAMKKAWAKRRKEGRATAAAVAKPLPLPTDSKPKRRKASRVAKEPVEDPRNAAYDDLVDRIDREIAGEAPYDSAPEPLPLLVIAPDITKVEHLKSVYAGILQGPVDFVVVGSTLTKTYATCISHTYMDDIYCQHVKRHLVNNYANHPRFV
jgi:hypothetical protein